MGLPSINIIFKAAAESTIQRIRKGVVAVIVRDAAESAQGSHVLTSESQIPGTLGTDNQAYIKRAFIGYEAKARQVLVYVLAVTATSFADAMAWLDTQSFDYLVGPPDITSDEAKELGDWVKEARADRASIAKAVLPNYAGDHEAIVNFSAAGIQVGETPYTAGAYASRIAGLIVGTPMTMSCTYAPLPEVTDIERLTPTEADKAVDDGKLILIHDGEKVKVGMGVNCLQTIRADQNSTMKKIKIVEVLDIINVNLRRACQDSWIGKHSASYDDKCLLISAVRDYLATLETEGIITSDFSVGIDLEAVREYLTGKGKDVSNMSEQELKEADTGNEVFLEASIHILDAIEKIRIRVNF